MEIEFYVYIFHDLRVENHKIFKITIFYFWPKILQSNKK
jgi:hypothetical protein